jgi:hypothetical protein
MAASAKTIDEFAFEPIAKGPARRKVILLLGAGASSFPRDLPAKPVTAGALARQLAKKWVHPQFQIFRDLTDSRDPAAQERRLRARLD